MESLIWTSPLSLEPILPLAHSRVTTWPADGNTNLQGYFVQLQTNNRQVAPTMHTCSGLLGLPPHWPITFVWTSTQGYNKQVILHPDLPLPPWCWNSHIYWVRRQWRHRMLELIICIYCRYVSMGTGDVTVALSCMQFSFWIFFQNCETTSGTESGLKNHTVLHCKCCW